MSKEILGEKLRRLRLDNHLPLRKVAATLDMDVAILSKMERGERKLTKSVVLKLAELYQQDPEELMVLFLGEKIMYEVGDEDLALKAMMAAEEQIQYRTRKSDAPNSSKNKEYVMKKIQKYFQSQHLVTKAWLFGSFARGDHSSKSDIDIVIDVPSTTKFTFFDLSEVQEQVEKIVNKKVDVVMLKGLRPEMRNRIKKDMQLIYET